jgi:hypothetical protein
MSIITRLFGFGKAEVRPQVGPDDQCDTCKSFLQHCERRVGYGGKVFCCPEHIPPSLIKSVEQEAQLKQQQASRAEQEGNARRIERQRANLEWAFAELQKPETQQYLSRLGISYHSRLRELTKQLNPHARKNLAANATCFVERVNGADLVFNPTD